MFVVIIMVLLIKLRIMSIVVFFRFVSVISVFVFREYGV